MAATFQQDLEYEIVLAKRHLRRLKKEMKDYYPSQAGPYPNPFNGKYSRAAVEFEISAVVVFTLGKVLDLFMEDKK